MSAKLMLPAFLSRFLLFDALLVATVLRLVVHRALLRGRLAPASFLPVLLVLPLLLFLWDLGR